MSTITLRPARKEDCRLLYNWAKDSRVRGASFNTAPISWEIHQTWFNGKIKDPSCYMLIAENEEGLAIGQVRFDVSEDTAEIDVTVDPLARGRGYGSRIIKMAVSDLFTRTPVREVHAFIKPDNTASAAAFERASFQRLGIETIRGNVAMHYFVSRES